MTIAGYNMRGDLDNCARETDKIKFLSAVKKLAIQRNVSQRTIILWCYLRSESEEMMERLKTWLAEEDATEKWLMPLPEYQIEDEQTDVSDS